MPAEAGIHSTELIIRMGSRLRGNDGRGVLAQPNS